MVREFDEAWERERTATPVRVFAVRLHATGCSLRDSSCRVLALVDTVPTPCVLVYDAFYDTLVPEDVLTLLVEVGAKYDCKSYPEAAETAALIALERNSADLAQILADQLAE